MIDRQFQLQVEYRATMHDPIIPGIALFLSTRFYECLNEKNQLNQFTDLYTDCLCMCSVIN